MADIVTTGLAQIPREGLERLIVHIEAGGLLCLSGHIIDPINGYG